MLEGISWCIGNWLTFRETSNKRWKQYNGRYGNSMFAEMQQRGMTMIALHNGGGVGIGKSINGGFGMVLDEVTGLMKYYVCLRLRT